MNQRNQKFLRRLRWYHLLACFCPLRSLGTFLWRNSHHIINMVKILMWYLSGHKIKLMSQKQQHGKIFKKSPFPYSRISKQTPLKSTTFVHNFCSKLLFTTFVHNFCSQLLCTSIVHNFCSNLLLTNFVQNYTWQFVFTSFVDTLCLKLLFQTFLHNFSKWLVRTSFFAKIRFPDKNNLFACLNVCSQLMLTFWVQNYCSQILFIIFVHSFYLQLLG